MANFELHNLCGAVYKRGNLVFTSDGNNVLSPVGNRITVFDLVGCAAHARAPPPLARSNTSRTLPCENRRDIKRLALSPDDSLLLSVDEDGRGLLVNFKRCIVLHHFNFGAPVRDVQFSPCGKLVAVTHAKTIQVWRAPSAERQFAPFHKYRDFSGHYDDTTCVSWSHDSRFLLAGSKAMTTRLYAVRPMSGFTPLTLGGGHRDRIVAACFSRHPNMVYTVSRCGVLNVWLWQSSNDEPPAKRARLQGWGTDGDSWGSGSDADGEGQGKGEEEGDDEEDEEDEEEREARTRFCAKHGRMVLLQKEYVKKDDDRVACAWYNPQRHVMVIGRQSGVFSLYEMPDLHASPMSQLHSLSVSTKRISTVSMNPSGEWLAIGSAALGQLVVWEWQSESYIMKQQGHSSTMTCLRYAADGQAIATGGRDAKVKLWNMQTGLCIATFNDHSQAVTALCISHAKHALYSAGLDGTVRAYDLLRYRCFRTFATPTPTQLGSVAVDPSGEVVCAASTDSFEIFVWSVQTGKLVDVLAGHEAPVSALEFNPRDGRLASSSWDRTVRIWNVFEGNKRATDVMQHTSDVLCVTWCPTSARVCSCSLDGQLWFWDVMSGQVVRTIEGRQDVWGGRKKHDLSRKAIVKHFDKVSYSVDGKLVIAAGKSRHVCLYSADDGILLERFQLTRNLNVDGVLDELNSKHHPRLALAPSDHSSDDDDRRRLALSGVKHGEFSSRRVLPAAVCHDIQMSPAGNGFACVSFEGLLVFGRDTLVYFDPTDLDMECTVANVKKALARGQSSRALVMSMRLNEEELIEAAYFSVAPADIPVVAEGFPEHYLDRLLSFIASQVNTSKHLEYHLQWCHHLMFFKGAYLTQHASKLLGRFRALNKAFSSYFEDLSKLCESNKYALEYLQAVKPPEVAESR